MCIMRGVGVIWYLFDIRLLSFNEGVWFWFSHTCAAICDDFWLPRKSSQKYLPWLSGPEKKNWVCPSIYFFLYDHLVLGSTWHKKKMWILHNCFWYILDCLYIRYQRYSPQCWLRRVFQQSIYSRHFEHLKLVKVLNCGYNILKCIPYSREF